MNILLVHQNFPAQFKHVAPALAANGAHRVVVFTMVEKPVPLAGVQMVSYRPGRAGGKDTHPWVQNIEAKVIRGSVALKAACKMRDEHGFTPDLIFAHHGWGESLFLKEVWPRAKVLLYAEWYYPLAGADLGFDAEFQRNDETTRAALRLKNAHNLLSMELADAGLSPTHWQRSTHPEWFRDRIEVIHDGIDTTMVRPGPAGDPLILTVPADAACGIEAGQVNLAQGEELVTFINRNLEPYRGYHVFMRALPELLRRRPKARVVIVGGNEVSYGAHPEAGTWKQKFLDEVRADLDLSRVHFVGKVPYRSFLELMRRTTVHVYLTYPFVLSWSLLEAMACQAAIVASDTAPVREVIVDGETGRLVDFFAKDALVDRICELAEDAGLRERLGRRARELVIDRYDLRSRCLPRQLALIDRVAAL